MYKKFKRSKIQKVYKYVFLLIIICLFYFSSCLDAITGESSVDESAKYETERKGGYTCSELKEIDLSDLDPSMPILPTDEQYEDLCWSCEDNEYEEPVCNSVVLKDGKMWTKCSTMPDASWFCAMCSTYNLELCGFKDWRLPTGQELKSLCNKEAKHSYWDDYISLWYDVAIEKPFLLANYGLWILTFGDDLTDEKSYSRQIQFELDNSLYDYCEKIEGVKSAEVGGYIAIRP